MKLVERLRQEVTIPIHTVDERLTSREADDRLRARGAGRNERRMRSDEYAALIILEDFLASSGSSKALQPQNPET
jgi:RNase H-fold protein (predicted Holliday junction resolvase)